MTEETREEWEKNKFYAGILTMSIMMILILIIWYLKNFRS